VRCGLYLSHGLYRVGCYYVRHLSWILSGMEENKSKERESDVDIATVYKELWLHIRHIENQRLAFMSLYLATYGVGIGSLLRGSVKNILFAYIVLGFILILSYLGLALSTRTMLTFWIHYRDIMRLQKKLSPSSFDSYEREQDSIEEYIFSQQPKYKKLNKFFIRVSKFGAVSLPLTLIFPLLYLLGGIISLISIVAIYVNPDLL